MKYVLVYVDNKKGRKEGGLVCIAVCHWLKKDEHTTFNLTSTLINFFYLNEKSSHFLSILELHIIQDDQRKYSSFRTYTNPTCLYFVHPSEILKLSLLQTLLMTKLDPDPIRIVNSNNATTQLHLLLEAEPNVVRETPSQHRHSG